MDLSLLFKFTVREKTLHPMIESFPIYFTDIYLFNPLLKATYSLIETNKYVVNKREFNLTIILGVIE